MSSKLVPHRDVVGTPRGYAWHQHREQQPCDACRAAKATYDRERSQQPNVRQLRALRNTARHRAEMELIKRHRAEFNLLYKRELAPLLARDTGTG